MIATIVSTTTGAVDNSNLPPDIKISTRDTITSGGDIATSFSIQLNNGVSRLPDPARRTVQDGIDRASEQFARLVPPGTEQAADSRASRNPGPRAGTPMTPIAPRAESAPAPSPADNGPAADYASIPPMDAAAIPYVSSEADIAVFVPWFRKAGALCAGIKAPTLAALYAAENGFRYGPTAPVSPAGAMGPGQFMPATWARYGKDVHGDGTPDVFDVGDSVMASGHLLCDTYQQIEQWKLHGAVRGDTLSLVLAAYNAGAGAVLRSGGMPTGSPDYEHQTTPYVSRILATQGRYDWISSDDYLLPAAANPSVTDLGLRIVDEASRYLGLPYVWGGGGSDGPTMGGFDCSGLTSFAVHAATGGRITLPRTSQLQWRIGREVALSAAAPGDLLFGNWGPDGPGHVAIYLGNGMMVQAPTTGDVVRISPVTPGMRARHAL
ncbi:NlpC/P60 family protein [Nocardia jiangxiensis]|uniref:NlpC/P60 family protein n=1 Tax=Nocardia jiangxiensis TaxID=282685 RepID=A0ABW6S8S9_9NOCA